MNTSLDSGVTRILRTTAWIYVAPRAAIGLLIMATLGLAGFLAFTQIALVILGRLGG